MKGPVDQIRLCDSDEDCPDGTRCLSYCNRWACVVQCIPKSQIPENIPKSSNQHEPTGKCMTKTESK